MALYRSCFRRQSFAELIPEGFVWNEAKFNQWSELVSDSAYGRDNFNPQMLKKKFRNLGTLELSLFCELNHVLTALPTCNIRL